MSNNWMFSVNVYSTGEPYTLWGVCVVRGGWKSMMKKSNYRYYVSMMSQEHGFIMAVEALLNMPVHWSISYMSVLFDELTRILNHIMCMTTSGLDIGALTPFLWGFEASELILQFYEVVSGSRMHAAYYRIGGIWSNISFDLLEKIYDFTFQYERYIDVIDSLLSSNSIWESRLVGVGLIANSVALDFGFSGPVLRGSGLPWDLRKVQPYEAYSKLDFKVSVSHAGDAYSRYLVRMLEMRESLKMMQQCVVMLLSEESDALDFWNMSQIYSQFISVSHDHSRMQLYLADLFNGGFVSLCDFGKNSNRCSLKNAMEELIFHFKEYSEGVKVPKGMMYGVVEAPKGETGVLLASDGSARPYSCKMKAPGFLHLQGLNYMSQNQLIADIVANIGSMDLVFGECDS